MSVGFRKSLFGFNCDDVIEYIKESHKKFADKESELQGKIESLDETISTIKIQLEEVKTAKAAVEAQLKEYTDKQEEIERLSQNIGRLYLVAQTNAKSIMRNSEESREVVSSEVESTLHSIDDAHTQLAQLKEEIIQTSDEFTKKVESLVASLSAAREKVSKNSSDSHELSEQFESLLSEIEISK